jgi:hypothetical protein
LDQLDFMRTSRLCVDGERKTSAVCHCQELRTFAPLGLSHRTPPFFATTNVPSMKHSDRSNSPRSHRSWAKVSKTRRSTPARTHCWKRRWQVWYGGNRSGKSFQRAPLRKIQRMPLSTARSSFHGRPRPSGRRGGAGMSGRMMFHCSSVNSSLRAILHHSKSLGVYETASSWAPRRHHDSQAYGQRRHRGGRHRCRH